MENELHLLVLTFRCIRMLIHRSRLRNFVSENEREQPVFETFVKMNQACKLSEIEIKNQKKTTPNSSARQKLSCCISATPSASTQMSIGTLTDTMQAKVFMKN